MLGLVDLSSPKLIWPGAVNNLECDLSERSWMQGSDSDAIVSSRSLTSRLHNYYSSKLNEWTVFDIKRVTVVGRKKDKGILQTPALFLQEMQSNRV